MNKLTDNQQLILDTYVKLLKKHKRLPSRVDMQNAGVNNNRIRKNFTSLTNLAKIVNENKPKLVESIIGFNIFETCKKDVNLNVKPGDKFVITTAVSDGKVHIGFLNSIRKYCKLHKARLLILPIEDPAKRKDKSSFYLSKELKDDTVIMSDTKINSNLFISSIKISAKQINPLTGLKRIGQRNGSCIYASPKQFMETVPVSNVKIPAVLMTTGSITLSDYNSDMYFSKRTAYIADSDHTVGAIIVEIKDDRVFYFRQIQSDKRGAFVDLGKMYSGKKVIKYSPTAFVPGDIHSGDTNPEVIKNWYEVSKETGCKKWILHDLYNGKAICHHDKKRCSLQAQKAEKGHLKMTKEFQNISQYLQDMKEHGINDIVIVKSNHDEWLDQWLQSGEYIHDPYNLKVALLLAEAQIKGFDPLKHAIETIGELPLNLAKKIKWLNRDEDYVIAKIECGAHGDLGSNGSRGNIRNLENAYGNCIIGHAHSPAIIRGVWVVGTSTYLKVGYNRGASGWCNSGVLIYPNGSRQMLFSIYGGWKL